MNADMLITIPLTSSILEYKYSNHIKVIIKRGGLYHDDPLFFRIHLVLFTALDISSFKSLASKSTWMGFLKDQIKYPISSVHISKKNWLHVSHAYVKIKLHSQSSHNSIPTHTGH